MVAQSGGVTSRAGAMVRWGDVENLSVGGLWEEPGKGLVGIREDGTRFTWRGCRTDG